MTGIWNEDAIFCIYVNFFIIIYVNFLFIFIRGPAPGLPLTSVTLWDERDERDME